MDHNGFVVSPTLHTSHCCKFEATDDLMSVTLSELQWPHRVVDMVLLGLDGSLQESLLLNHIQSDFKFNLISGARHLHT